jgi:hypothetical protein
MRLYCAVGHSRRASYAVGSIIIVHISLKANKSGNIATGTQNRASAVGWDVDTRKFLLTWKQGKKSTGWKV